jgi:ComEC/Rec2-related protein
MSAIFLIGMVSSRQPIPINSLCAAGFVILAQATNELFSPGFQLSFAVVAAILLVAQPLQARIRRGLDPDPFLPVALWDRWQKVRHDAGGGLAGLLAVSVAAWLGSLPLTVYYFHMISLSALVANPVVVPLAFVIMATAMASLLGGVVSVGLAAIFNNANLVFTRVLIAIIQGTASLPGAFVAVGHWNPAPVQITVFDFGSGGAAAIESKGRLWLLDCGSTWDWENSISPWMRSIGKWSPDGLLLTHGDADHIGGALALLQGGRPEILIDSPLKDRSSARRKIHQFLEAKDRPPSIRCAGDCLTMSPCAQAFILHPPADLVANLADDKAFVVRVDGAGGKVLFLSDVGPATCSWLLDNQRTEMAADIVVLGRHRSGIAPDATFLHEVNPTLVVASAAGFPKNEPIDEKWAAMLEEMGIGLFRQDETGAVQLRLLPGHYEAEAFMTGEKVEHPFRQ